MERHINRGVNMKKYIVFGLILLGSWMLALRYYGESGISRYAAPLSEIILILSSLYTLQFIHKKQKYFFRFVLSILIFIYFLQCIYYSQVGEFITILALENIDQAYLLIRPVYIALFIGILFVTYVMIKNESMMVPKKRYRYISYACIVFSLIIGILQNIHVPANNIITNSIQKIEKGGTPILSLCINLEKEFMPVTDHQKKIAGYPFEKNWIYHNPLPFQQKASAVKKPNVILIFTEGTSARLLGCYNEKYTNVTPNIDSFSKMSTTIDRYYNHTAATFRGTHGQLASCYPRYGGYEKGGWAGTKEGSGASKQLSHVEYQTLPKLLNEQGYTTTFISPHMKSDPYTDLLNMLGFQQVYTRDDAANILGKYPQYWHSSITDQDTYSELINLLERKEDEDMPFFLSMYTFETHTNVDTQSDELKYGDASNETLNTLHNVDDAFGRFWQYFQHSKYKDNTIIIFTADHCHYHDKPFMELVKNDSDYVKCFFDRIPLIIYDPIHSLPARYDAENNTSISLPPTVCQLLGINNTRNSFMGTSIFEPAEHLPVSAAGMDFYTIFNNHIARPDQLDEEDKEQVNEQIDRIKLFYDCEKYNRVFHKE